MHRTGSNYTLKMPVIYSVAAHCAVLALMSISSFAPHKNDIVLTDIQIVGEGELQDILNNYQTDPAQITPSELHEEPEKLEKKEEPKPVEEESHPELPSDEQLPPAEPEELVEPAKPAEPQFPLPPTAEPEPQPQQQPEPLAPEPEEPAPSDEIVFEELPQSEAPDPKEEIVSQEEPVPTPEKSEKPREPIPDVKKASPRHHRKALQNAIKRAEKKRAKERNRKKMLEIAENAEKTKKMTQKKKNNAAFDKMLNNSINDLNKVSGKGQKGRGAGSFGSGANLTDSDYEIISSQIYPHWVVPSGVRDAENIIVEIEVQLRDNGEVIPSGVKILDERRYASDYVFRAAADSARRAVLEASPLRIPRDKMSVFKNFVLRFNLREALGG